MFLSSVFVPSSVLPDRADRDVGVAAQRPLLHVHVADPELAQRLAQQVEPVARLLGRAQVGLGHDLRQRRATAVVVDDRRVRAVDAAGLADVHELRRVLLEVDAVQPHVAQVAACAERDVVLGDLVALGEVGIEVVLAVEDRPRGDLAAERQPHHQPEVDGLGVGHRQRAGQPEADRAGARVRLLAEAQRAAAEHLRARRELHVDLEADHRLVRRHARAPEPSKPIACSSACAASRMRFSLNAGPASWKRGRQPAGEAVRDRDRRDPGQRHRHRAEVVQVHRQRIGGLGAELERDARRGRRDDEVDVRPRVGEVARDQRADLLGAAVVGVVVAARQRVGAEHDAALDLGAEALLARLRCTCRAGRRHPTRRP